LFKETHSESKMRVFLIFFFFLRQKIGIIGNYFCTNAKNYLCIWVASYLNSYVSKWIQDKCMLDELLYNGYVLIISVLIEQMENLSMIKH